MSIFFKNVEEIKEEYDLIFDIDNKKDSEIRKNLNEFGWINPPESPFASDTDFIAFYSYYYAYKHGLREHDLTGFVSTISLLITGMGASLGVGTKKDIQIENQAIDFLNSLNITEMNEIDKAKALLHFVLILYSDDNKLIKKSVVLSSKHIEEIEKLEGDNFSEKLRYVIDYFLTEKN